MLKNDTTFLLTKYELEALLANASADPCRVNLHGVWFDTVVGSAQTTSGHTALVCEPADTKQPLGANGWGNATVLQAPYDAMKQAAKIARKSDVILVTFDAPNRRAELVVRGPYPERPKTIDAALQSGNERHRATLTLSDDLASPPFSSVIPDINRQPSIGVGIAPRYLAVAGKLAKILDDEKSGVCFYVSNPLEPVLIRARGADDSIWKMVIMPIRMGELDRDASIKWVRSSSRAA